jgi:DNA topoisomerase IB
LKEEKLKQEEKYMWAIVDGVKEKVGNFRVEPPGLFRGRGEHPKMGKLKRRIKPSDITINIGKGAPIPECPIPGESWKEVKHDNTVTWLAFWNDPISQKDFKYVFLAASSALKGQSDKEKYEKSRKLKHHVHKIRDTYTKDFRSKDKTKKQIAVATYLIDKLALRAGNEKVLSNLSSLTDIYELGYISSAIGADCTVISPTNQPITKKKGICAFCSDISSEWIFTLCNIAFWFKTVSRISCVAAHHNFA